jgi:site-specific DNA-adenine methylase
MTAATPKPKDALLAALNHQLDRAVQVVPHPRDNFASAIRAMQNGSYDTPSGRYHAKRFPRLEAHELVARDITAAVAAAAPERESEFLQRVSVRLRAE